MGGGAAIVKAMTKAIKSYHGEIKTSTAVKEILIENGKAIGVVLENGEQIKGKNVISNADPTVTYRQLIGPQHISKALSQKLDQTKYSCSSLMLFLIVDMDLRAAGLDSGNIWMMKEENSDLLFNDLMKTDISEGEYFSGLFVSCTTLKDPSSFDGKHHVLEVVTFIDRTSFDHLQDENGKRSEAYVSFKEKMSAKMLHSLETVIPGISNHIVHQELGTPLTNEHYINSTAGSVYGTEKSFKQTGPFSYKAQSEIANLYLCGASIMSHGVAGAAYSGVQTAAIILGCKQEDLIQADSSQHLQIYNAESDQDYPEWLAQKIAFKKNKNRAQ